MPLDKIFTVHLASDGSEVYAGTETGLYRSGIGPPWHWTEVADLNPVIAIEPVPGKEDTLYLATDMSDQDKGDIYRWQPPAAPEHLMSVANVPIALAPYPSPADSVAVFVLLFGGEVLAVRPDGQSHFLGNAPAISFDLMAIPPANEQPARLLLGSESGLLEYRESFDFRR